MEYSALGIAEHEIEAHFAANNAFQEQSRMTLDDLNFYAVPLGAVVRALHLASTGGITREQAYAAMDKAIAEYKALDDALDLENAA